MSLVNKMLQDLETRESRFVDAAIPVYRDLRSVGTNKRRSVPRLLVVSIGVLGIGAAIYFAAGRMGFVPAAPAAVGTKPAQTALPRTAASTVAAAPSPVVRRPVRTVSDPNPVVPATTTASAAPHTVAATAPPPVTARSEPAAVASPHSPDSQKRARVRIVAKKEPIPTPVHRTRRQAAKPKARPRAKRRVMMGKGNAAAVVHKKVHPLTAAEEAEASYRRAVHFLDQGRAEDAEAALREALRAQPAHIKARELAAGLALQSGHWRRAQSLLEEGLRQVPSHYPFARMLARVYLEHGSEAKALAVMESAAPHGSDDPDFSALLGLLYQRAGHHADAVKAYERSLAQRPDDGRTWLGFAIALESVEHWGAAKNAYQRAEQSGGLSPRLRQYAAQRMAALKDR